MGCFDCEKPLQEDFLLNVFFFFLFFPQQLATQTRGRFSGPCVCFFSPPMQIILRTLRLARSVGGPDIHSRVVSAAPKKKEKESTSARIKACCRPAAQHENTTSWSSVGGPAVIVSCQTSKVLPHSFAPDILLPFIYFFFPIRWYFGGGATRDQI